MKRPSFRRPPIKHYYIKAATQTTSWIDRIDHLTGGFFRMVLRALFNFFTRDLREAAALSYYALFSIFPLVLLIIVVISWIIGPRTIENQIEDLLSFFLPGETATELNNTIARFIQQGGSASLVAISSFIWSSSAFFSNLEATLSRTFRDTSQRPFWQRRINSFLMIFSLGLLLIANLVTTLLFSLLNLFFLDEGNVWLSVASVFVPFGFGMGIFAMLYRWVPRNRVPWDAIWPAALLGAILWEAAKRVFGWYLDRLDNLSLVYGSITTVIIFMLWTYYTSCILILCAEFCVSLADWLEERRQRHPERHDFAQNYYELGLKLPEGKEGGKSSKMA